MNKLSLVGMQLPENIYKENFDVSSDALHLQLLTCRDAGTGGGRREAAPLALYQEGQGGRRWPFD